MRSAKLPNKLTPLNPAYVQLLQTWDFPFSCQWFSGTETGGGGRKAVNSGSDDSRWLFINLVVSNVWVCKEITAGDAEA